MCCQSSKASISRPPPRHAIEIGKDATPAILLCNPGRKKQVLHVVKTQKASVEKYGLCLGEIASGWLGQLLQEQFMAKIVAKELRNMKGPDFSFCVQLISQAGRREAMLVVVGKREQITRSESVAAVLGVDAADATQQPRVRRRRAWGLPAPPL